MFLCYNYFMVKHLKTLLLLFLAFEVKGFSLNELFENVRFIKNVEKTASSSEGYKKLFNLISFGGVNIRIIGITYDTSKDIIRPTDHEFDPKIYDSIQNHELKEIYSNHCRLVLQEAELIEQLELASETNEEIIDSFLEVQKDPEFLGIFHEEQGKLKLLYELISKLNEDETFRFDYSQYELIFNLIVEYCDEEMYKKLLLDKDNRGFVGLRTILEYFESFSELSSDEDALKVQSLKESNKKHPLFSFNVDDVYYENQSLSDKIESINCFLKEIGTFMFLSALKIYAEKIGESVVFDETLNQQEFDSFIISILLDNKII